MSSSITVSLLWFQTSSKARRTRALFWSDIVGSFPSGSSREGTAAPHLREQQASAAGFAAEALQSRDEADSAAGRYSQDFPVLAGRGSGPPRSSQRYDLSASRSGLRWAESGT